jgi:hypothetical protein
MLSTVSVLSSAMNLANTRKAKHSAKYFVPHYFNAVIFFMWSTTIRGKIQEKKNTTAHDHFMEDKKEKKLTSTLYGISSTTEFKTAHLKERCSKFKV